MNTTIFYSDHRDYIAELIKVAFDHEEQFLARFAGAHTKWSTLNSLHIASREIRFTIGSDMSGRSVDALGSMDAYLDWINEVERLFKEPFTTTGESA